MINLLSVDNTLEENLHYDEFPNKYSLSIDCGSSACYFDEILHVFTNVPWLLSSSNSWFEP